MFYFFSDPSHLQTSVIGAECEFVAPEHCDPPALVTELPVTAEAGVRTRGQDQLSPASEDKEGGEEWDHDHGDGELRQLRTESRCGDTERSAQTTGQGQQRRWWPQLPNTALSRACYLVTGVRYGQKNPNIPWQIFIPRQFLSYPRDFKLHIWPAIL